MRFLRTRSRAVPDEEEFTSQQQKLLLMSGQVLERYREELSRQIEAPERLAAVYGERFMSSTLREQAHIVAQMAASMLGVPNAQVNIIVPGHEITIASVGRYAPGTMPVGESWCQNVIGTGRELAVTDGQFHPLVCDTRFSREGEIVSYLGVPVVNRDGFIVGVLCTFDDVAHDWGPVDVGILTQLSMILTKAGSA